MSDLADKLRRFADYATGVTEEYRELARSAATAIEDRSSDPMTSVLRGAAHFDALIKILADPQKYAEAKDELHAAAVEAKKEAENTAAAAKKAAENENRAAAALEAANARMAEAEATLARAGNLESREGELNRRDAAVEQREAELRQAQEQYRRDSDVERKRLQEWQDRLQERDRIAEGERKRITALRKALEDRAALLRTPIE